MDTTFLHATGISGRVYLAQYVEGFTFDETFKCFCLPQNIKYDAYGDDFGPMNMSCIVDFIRMLDTLLATWTNRKLVLCSDSERRP